MQSEPKTLREYCKANDFWEDGDKRGWFFVSSVRDAVPAIRHFNGRTDLPAEILSRQCHLRAAGKDRRLTLTVPREKTDPDFPRCKSNGRLHHFPLDAPTDLRPDADQLASADPRVIVCRCSNADRGQWYLSTKSGLRCRYSTYETELGLTRALEGTDLDALDLMGIAIQNPCQLACIPFATEFDPVKRIYNPDGAKLRHRPQPGPYPHWQKIFAHIFGDLDEPLKAHPIGDIDTGAKYGAAWVASMIRQPAQPLPFLFCHGPQDAGKSIFHESIAECLISGGVASGDSALTAEHNGELDGAVLVYVEEKNVARDRQAYNRLKQSVTAIELSIHRKFHTPYRSPNFTHWVMCANDRENCPIVFGDSRIVYLHVPAIPRQELIPKTLLLEKLQAEAPAFTTALLAMPLPEPTGRLALPVVETTSKRDAAESAVDELARGLLALMGDSSTLRVTVRQIKNDLPDLAKPPGNMRSVERRLSGEGESSCLSSLGIKWWTEPDPDGSAVLVMSKQAPAQLPETLCG